MHSSAIWSFRIAHRALISQCKEIQNGYHQCSFASGVLKDIPPRRCSHNEKGCKIIKPREAHLSPIQDHCAHAYIRNLSRLRILSNALSYCAIRTCPTLTHSTHAGGSTPMKQPCRGFSRHVVIKDGQVVDAAKIKKICSENDMVFKEGHACIITTCPRFTQRRLKMDEIDQLYINKTTGMSIMF